MALVFQFSCLLEKPCVQQYPRVYTAGGDAQSGVSNTVIVCNHGGCEEQAGPSPPGLVVTLGLVYFGLYT